MTLTVTGAFLPSHLHSSYQPAHAQYHMMQQQQQQQQPQQLDQTAQHYQQTQQVPMMHVRSAAAAEVESQSSTLSPHTLLTNEEASTTITALPDAMPPSCTCLGNASNYRYEENREGCYYTQLGVGSSLHQLRQIFEARTGLKDVALRFEKINYTTKEGKSKEGCPVAKWIIRRSGIAEKMLVLVKQRRGHKCPHAWIVVAVVVWEALDSDLADDIYDYLRVRLPEDGFVTERRCGLNEARSCACQGFDDETGGASYSFGCSWSMYSNSCKFSRTRGDARKFKLRCADNEAELQHRLQFLATVVAPLMARVVPEAYNNLVANEATAGECRLGLRPGRPFASVTACLDFATHAHRDQHNMNGGCTAVVSLTRHRGFGRPNDEQLHVLPMYTLDSTDETGATEGQLRKVQCGALEMLTSFPRITRLRSAPLGSCNARKKAKLASNRALREAAATAAGGAANKNREERSPSSIDSGVCVKSPSSELSPKSEPAVSSEPPLQMPIINTELCSFPTQEAPSPSSVLPSIESWFRKPQLKSSQQAPMHVMSNTWSSQSHASVQQMPSAEPTLPPSWCRMPSQGAPGLYNWQAAPTASSACGYNFAAFTHGAVQQNHFAHYAPQVPFYDAQQYHRFSSMNNYVPITPQQQELHRQQQYHQQHQQLQLHQQFHMQQQPMMQPFQNLTTESSEESALHLSQSSQQHFELTNPPNSSNQPKPQFSANSDKSPSSINRFSTVGQKRLSNDGTTGVDQEYLTDNEEIFLDAEIGGVGIALSHGSILFEVAKKELHSTTSLRSPNRRLPSRISIIFYQHKNLHYAHHGFYEEEKRKEKRRAIKEAETSCATSPLASTSSILSSSNLSSSVSIRTTADSVTQNVHPSYSAVMSNAPQQRYLYDYPKIRSTSTSTSSSSFCQTPIPIMKPIKEEASDPTFVYTASPSSRKPELDLASISVDSLLDESPLTSLSHYYVNSSLAVPPDYFF